MFQTIMILTVEIREIISLTYRTPTFLEQLYTGARIFFCHAILTGQGLFFYNFL